MASTYSDNLKIELIGTGDQSGNWGNTTNTNLGVALEEAISGQGSVVFATDGTHTLTLNNSNTSQTARSMTLNVTSAVPLTVTRNLVVPTIKKLYVVRNLTTGGQSIVVKTASGTGLEIPNGKTTIVYADGVNVVSAVDYAPITIPPGGITYTYKNTNYTAEDKDGIIADTTAGTFTITLPAAPTQGAQVVIADGGNWAVNNLNVARNGSTIEGLAEDLVMNIGGAAVTFVYDGTTWEIYGQVGAQSGEALTLDGVQVVTNKDMSSGTNSFPSSLATLTGTQTLSNKTLTTPINVGTRETRVALPASDIDLSTGNFFSRTISGATALTVSNVPTTGTAVSFILDLTNGGSATITWWSGVKWTGGVAPILTSAGRDVLGFFTYDGGTTWTGVMVGKDVK